jgi:hypothetical protein
MNRRRLGEWIVSRSAKPHYRNRVDASVFRGERETPAADEAEQPAQRDSTRPLTPAIAVVPLALAALAHVVGAA